jgi:EAL domain-containing protein (putative c-di-GMP-specific phosphodiesterase class I)
LSYLVTLPLNEIKIDRSFVVGMFLSPENLRIVRTIIDLTHDLGMVSLAEGVEEVVQRDQLLALGCTKVQGYFYGKPMSLANFVTWYRARQA